MDLQEGKVKRSLKGNKRTNKGWIERNERYISFTFQVGRKGMDLSQFYWRKEKNGGRDPHAKAHRYTHKIIEKP